MFGLRNINELPSLSEIDEILPDGINEEDHRDDNLAEITDQLSEELVKTYSEGESELLKITEKLTEIQTTSDFFE